MGRLNLVASNPVQDGIDAYSSLSNTFIAQDAAKLAEARDVRDAATAKLSNQVAQNQLDDHDNVVADRRLGALRVKIQSGTATPDDLAEAADEAGAVAGTPVQPAGAISLPTDPHDATVAAVQAKAPSLWAQMSAPDSTPAGLTKQQIADRATLLNTLNRMNQAKSTGTAYAPTVDEYTILAREVVNNPAFSDSGLAAQHKALGNVNAAFNQLKSIVQPTMITDPAILASINAAFPRLAADSNLAGAQATKLYVQPSPDGDPMKARLTIGVSGKNDKGEVVDGVVTHNRSSAPDDTVLTMTGGQWITQAQQKQAILDGLIAAQVEHGNKEAMPIYEKLQANRAMAQQMLEAAGKMQPGTDRDELTMAGRMLLTGKIDATQATTIADKFHAPIHKREAAKAAHDQAIELEGLRAGSAERMNAATNATSIAGHKISAAATTRAAEIHEAGRRDSENKTTIRTQSAQAIELSKEISAQETRLYPITVSTDNPLDPAHPITKTTHPTAEAIPGIKANIEAKKKEYARLTGQPYTAPASSPTAARNQSNPQQEQSAFEDALLTNGGNRAAAAAYATKMMKSMGATHDSKGNAY